ncbi:MAG: hypothetical protein FJ308_04520 [Planctomycetes bacterium]|nr:hypothetical protein [Planctomycetota bacterium]
MMRSKPSMLLLYLAVLTCIGCTRQVRFEYGESEGSKAKSSPSGLAVFREMVKVKGFDTYTVRSLSPGNMNRLNTIIWSPDAFPVHDAATYYWLSQWLSRGNRTLIYIGRDYSPNVDYWRDLANSPATQKNFKDPASSARDWQALEQSRLDQIRRANRDTIIMPWLRWDCSNHEMEQIYEFAGPLSKFVDASNAKIFLRTHPTAIAPDDENNIKKNFDWEPNSAKPVPTTNAYEKTWTPSDESQQQIISQIPFDDAPTITPDLLTGHGRILIGTLLRPEFLGGRVIVVANNSFFSNYSMLHESHRSIASSIIKDLPKGGVGFITGSTDPMVRENDAEEQQQGLEMLTLWPLNVITIHAAILGLIALIAAFPIFGRPKRLRQDSNTDFGQHITAVGKMLERTGDADFATRTIAEYFRKLKKDPASPWATMDTATLTPKSPFAPSSTQTTAPPVEQIVHKRAPASDPLQRSDPQNTIDD